MEFPFKQYRSCILLKSGPSIDAEILQNCLLLKETSYLFISWAQLHSNITQDFVNLWGFGCAKNVDIMSSMIAVHEYLIIFAGVETRVEGISSPKRSEGLSLNINRPRELLWRAINLLDIARKIMN